MMFIEVFIFSIIIGYLLKGSVKNIQTKNFNNLWLVYISFFIEALIIFFIRNNYLLRGRISYTFNFIMYILLLMFVIKNIHNKWIVLIGIGFLLNAIVIFLNDGAMPVSGNAVVLAGLAPSLEAVKVSNEGLYTLIDKTTRLWFLGDIIPKPFLRPAVVSIGDFISAVGLIFLIITNMKNQSLD